MRQPHIEFYDPLLRPFEIRAKDRMILTTAGTKMFVVAGHGLDWNAHRDLLFHYTELAPFGFVAVDPWVPGANALKQGLRNIVDVAQTVDHIQIANFKTSRSTFESVFDLSITSGGWASGEWCLGAAHEPIHMVVDGRFEELGGFPDALLLANLESVECGLALAEHQRSLFALRGGDNADPRISELRAILASP